MTALKSWSRDHPLAIAGIGTFLAIAGTAALDAVGFGLNIFPLVLLFFLFWYLQRLSRVEVGLTWGQWRYYGRAVSYPVVVLAVIGLVAWFSAVVTLHSIDWSKVLLTLVAQLALTVVFGLVTEEGIFRGWLWASLQRAGVTELWVLVLTSGAFAAWHISTALLPTPVQLPVGQVPVYILTAGVGGFNWAQMRRRSGSIVVTSVSHGVWNSLAYVLFGEGTALGVLGIHNIVLFGPDVGVFGLVLNLVFAAALWIGFGRARVTASPAVVVEGTR